MDSTHIFPYSNFSVRNINKRAILELIRFAPGGISRAELARQIDLTRSTVSSIVAVLLQARLVRESDSGPTTGGRRPILLEFNPQRGFLVGVDMGVTHLSLVAADFMARVLHEVEVPFCIEDGPNAGLVMLGDHLRELLEKAGIELGAVLAMGVGVPCPVLAEAGKVGAPPIMPGWDRYPIQESLEKMWGCPISLNNDAELGALGEWAYGAGRKTHHMAYIKVGTGIGAGLILDGRIYRGSTGLAGEIGHLTILEDGPRCSCGNRGCLETLASGAAIARKAMEAVREGRRTLLTSVKPVENLTARHVGEAARHGDLVAQQIIAEAGYYLGIAIAGIINFSNPSMVVVGGGVAQMGDLLLEPIRHVVRERSIQPAAQAARITAAVLGRRSTSIGAVVQAVDTVLYELTEGSLNAKGGFEKEPFKEKKLANTGETIQPVAGVTPGH